MLTDLAPFANQTSIPLPSAMQPDSDPLEIPESDRAGPVSAAQGELFDTAPPPWELAVEEDVAMARIVFSEAPHGPYDYRIPEEFRESLRPGMRVRVPFGRRRNLIAGWCIETHFGSGDGRSLRDVGELLDDQPLCDPPLVRLVLWMSHYYLAPAGQVFDALIPSSVRGGAGTRQRTYFTPHPTLLDDRAIESLPVKQQAVARFLVAAARPLTAAQLMVEADCTKDPINRLHQKGLIAADVRREMFDHHSAALAIGRWGTRTVTCLDR